jgi:hypothetical protein
MIITTLLNTENENTVLFDVCIPCYSTSQKLIDTVNSITTGPNKITLPSKLILGIEKQSVVANRLACLTESKASYVLWLDDDVIFETPNWDVALFNSLYSDSSIGIVSIWAKNAWQLKKFGNSYKRPDGFVNDVCGAVMMCRKINNVNFDTNYVGSQWEDTDYCYAVRKAGYKVLQNNNLYCIHVNQEVNRNYSENEVYFKKKWGT